MHKKNYRHNPTHIFMDDTPYFITAAIYQKRCLLKNPEHKEHLLNCIKYYFDKYQWALHHWVILDNHYHLLGQSRIGQDLSLIMTQIHSVSGYHIKQVVQTQRRIWWNYWDYCPRDEKDYLVRLNYLLINPIKHGYTSNLYDYPFSSFHQYIAETGRESLMKQFKEHTEHKSLILPEDDF
jgi:putative transposase